LEGPGASSYQCERSRRVDTLLEPELYEKVHEVDAVMRGPMMLRKALLEELGYLDEDSFAPLYQDDMDLCFRLRENGYSVFYYPIDVVNEMSTVSRYDRNRSLRWQAVVDEHLWLFYDRWNPNDDKSSYLILSKPRFCNLYHPAGTAPKPLGKASRPPPVGFSRVLRGFRLLRKMLNIFDSNYCAALADRMWRRRVLWTQEQIAFLPAGTRVLDVGAGTAPYRQNFAHCEYVTQDLAQTPGLHYGKIDIISDCGAIPVADESFDAVLCTEVLEHVPDPIGTLREIARILRPGGKLILTAPLGSGLHQLPYHYYGGFTRSFYERYLPEFGLSIVSIEANGGLFGHLVEMNGTRAYPHIEKAFGSRRRLFRPFIRLVLQNIPAIVYSMAEDRMMIEDFTVGYHVVAEKHLIKDDYVSSSDGAHATRIASTKNTDTQHEIQAN
jgi:ubiquinone/menaquinone biosynthesis C-methylase UbiE